MWTPQDFETVARVAGKIDANPVRVVARMAGLGGDEIESGVPAWAWVLVALGTGAALGVVFGPRLRAKVGKILDR